MGSYEVSVIRETGQGVKIVIRNANTIHDLKKKIKKQTGVPVKKQKLSYGGQELENSKKVKHYKIIPSKDTQATVKAFNLRVLQ